MASPKRTKGTKCGHRASQADQQVEIASSVLTTLFVSNLHCPSCVSSIEKAISQLTPKPLNVSASIVSHSVTVSHYPALSCAEITRALEGFGFDIHSAFQDGLQGEPQQILPHPDYEQNEQEDTLEQAVKRWQQAWRLSKGKEKDLKVSEADMVKRARHAEQCAECQAELENSSKEVALRQSKLDNVNGERREQDSPDDLKAVYGIDLNEVYGTDRFSSADLSTSIEKFDITVDSYAEPQVFQAELSIVGMTCSACVGSITGAIERIPWVRSVHVALLTNSAVVIFEGKGHDHDLISAIEAIGFDASVERLEKFVEHQDSEQLARSLGDQWRAAYSVGGMTCSACVGSVTKAIQQHDWVDKVDINLLSNSAVVSFTGEDHLAAISEAIESAGFEAHLDNVARLDIEPSVASTERVVSIHISGMYCHHCPGKVLNALKEVFAEKVAIEHAPSLRDPVLTIRYVARLPQITIRSILMVLVATDSTFNFDIYHAPTIEDKSRELQSRERRRILIRLALSISAAIPAFIIGVVCMSLLQRNDRTRIYFMTPTWAGTVTRAEWSLFILSTPVFFFGADIFHRKALKELKVLWKPGNPAPIVQRLTLFGSMNMLMSLGTTIAYISSVAELIVAATQKSVPDMDPAKADNSFYFDSVVFLTMFLLIGRFLEAYSKTKAGDAVSQLGKLRPTQAHLIDQVERTTMTTPVDLLEVGDLVRIPQGASPPFDGVVVDGKTVFDESSLTGESRLVSKTTGYPVFSGTVNKGAPISIRLTGVHGRSMLDQIIKVVREGQACRAPVERVADVITSHFVPLVVAIGILTWIIWLTLGESGTLPTEWLDVSNGGWALWSLRFAIAVFVIACPCGIGLAAPTALFVGGGLAAKHGILVKGGGEAFQEASSLDYIVFDKTGTLTEGGAPVVSDYRPCSDDDWTEILGMTMALEQQSGHPIASAIVKFCEDNNALPPTTKVAREFPGLGMQGSFHLKVQDQQTIDVDCLVGNERLMTEHDVDIPPVAWACLQSWERKGKSVVLVALRAHNPGATNHKALEKAESRWTLSAIFAIADVIRPEAAPTVRALQSRGIGVWMLSGDNQMTAQTVAGQVGIDPQHVIAGVLPEQKADKIRYLQKTLPFKGRNKKHATVAMVGDGINDSPALTMADIGIAIGSGSDVAISSAQFILISSNLGSLLTLIDLSRAVFRRIWFNFGWALVYNVIAMPIAAGVLYPVKTGSGQHIRLDPVWASLAMALSSVSVVSSSLLLRSKLPIVGFVERKPTRRENNTTMTEVNYDNGRT